VRQRRISLWRRFRSPAFRIWIKVGLPGHPTGWGVEWLPNSPYPLQTLNKIFLLIKRPRK